MVQPRKHLSAADKRALGAAVVYYRERADSTTAELARRAGVAPPTLHAIEKGEAEPRWVTMRQIATGLSIPFPEFVAEVERREASPDGGGVGTVVSSDPWTHTARGQKPYT